MWRLFLETTLAFGSVRSIGASSFLQAKSAARGDNACECRNWKQTYEGGVTKCGMANEFYTASGKSWLAADEVTEYWDKVGKAFCTDFFEKIDDNFCANVNMGEDRGSWCFVDAACSKLNGGARLTKKLAWKQCSPSEDRMLRSYSPEELQRLAKAHDYDMGFLHKMSYPMSKRKWHSVSSLWNATYDSLAEVPESLQQFNISLPNLKFFLKGHWGKPDQHVFEPLRTEMQRVIDGDKYMSFDTERHHAPPHVIVKGRKVYLVMPDLVCLSGCDQ